MYLHLGQGVVAKTREIIGIFDLDTSTIRGSTREFLAAAEKENRVTTVAMDELPKAFVVCDSGQKPGKDKRFRRLLASGQKPRVDEIFISPLAAATLLKRNEMGRFL